MLATTLGLTQDEENTIIKLMRTTSCPSGFACLAQEKECLCRMKLLGECHFGQCLDTDGPLCKFSLSFGHGLLCKCSIRLYLARTFGI